MKTTTTPRPGAEVREGLVKARPVADRRAVWAGAGLWASTFVGYLPGLGRALDFDSAQTVGMFIKPGPPWAAFRLQAAVQQPPHVLVLRAARPGRHRPDRRRHHAAAAHPLRRPGRRRAHLVHQPPPRSGRGPGRRRAAGVQPDLRRPVRGVRGYSLLVLCAIVASILVAEYRLDGSRRADLAYACRSPAPASPPTSTCSRCWSPTSGRSSPGAGWTPAGGSGSPPPPPSPPSPTPAWRRRWSTPWAASRGSSRSDCRGGSRSCSTGGGRASLAAAPLVIAGAVLLLRRNLCRPRGGRRPRWRPGPPVGRAAVGGHDPPLLRVARSRAAPIWPAWPSVAYSVGSAARRGLRGAGRAGDRPGYYRRLHGLPVWGGGPIPCR